MALIKNIAGVTDHAANVGTVTATGQIVNDPAAGLYSQLLRTAGGAGIPVVSEVIQAVELGLNLLPPGGLKKWLTIATNPIAFAEAIKTLFTGRTYTTGQYRLAERYIDQVLSPGGNPNSILSYRDVPDDVVPTAIVFFTVVFGVRITTDEDLWALDSGATAYLARPGVDYKGMGDNPNEAIARAVMLKQTYYPSSTYNTSTWNLDYFSQFPLVAPIPDPYVYGKKYTGPLPGGGQATDGYIQIDTKTPLSAVEPQPGAATQAKVNPLIWLGLGALAIGGYFYYENQKGGKPKKSVYGF